MVILFDHQGRKRLEIIYDLLCEELDKTFCKLTFFWVMPGFFLMCLRLKR